MKKIIKEGFVDRDIDNSKIMIWVIYLLTLITIILNIFLDLPSLEKIPWNYWIVIALLVIRIVVAEVSVPRLYIEDCGSEPKLFRDDKKLYSYLSVYIDVGCRGAVATNVFPVIEWIDVANGQISFKNSGRWFIPNEDKKDDILGLQTVTISPNGMTWRLHFARLNDDGMLCAWSRKPDGHDELHTLRPAPSEFLVKITLRSGNKSKCTGQYIVKNPKPRQLKINQKNDQILIEAYS